MFKLSLLTSSFLLITSTNSDKHTTHTTHTTTTNTNIIHNKQQEHGHSIAKKLQLISNEGKTHSLLSSTTNHPTFDSLLSEITKTKEIHGKVISPEVYNKLLNSENNNLRSLSKKNNFLELAVFQDIDCTQKSRAVGKLVNFCYNEWDSSYLFKVNRKENLILQVTYSKVDCRGVPDAVYDLQSITHTAGTEFSQCVNGVQWSYLADYPVFLDQGAAYGATYTDQTICDSTVKNYHGYDFRKAGFCSKVALQNSVYVKSDVAGCDSGQISVNYYFDSTCAGTVANSQVSYLTVCMYPDWWQGDDADDFKQDGSNYVIGEVHTDYCYDPTHSPAPAPITSSCDIPYFMWVGDGYCDSVANNPECNYDGGDCCPQTCVATQWECGTYSSYNCIDPDVV